MADDMVALSPMLSVQGARCRSNIFRDKIFEIVDFHTNNVGMLPVALHAEKLPFFIPISVHL
jgi:hypothetical protein